MTILDYHHDSVQKSHYDHYNSREGCMCSSYWTTMLVTEPASSFSASLRVLHSDGYLVRLHVRVRGSWCQSPTLCAISFGQAP